MKTVLCRLSKFRGCLIIALLIVLFLATAAIGNEIVIGNTVPYSGPASAYGVIGHAMNAYFQRLNDQGGINGNKIRFVSLDDGYSPPKTLEQTRKLVEQDKVLFLAGSLGTATQSAVHKYLNSKQIPQLFVTSGTSKWADPDNYPWTMPALPTYATEGSIYGRAILRASPSARIAVLSPNDDSGRDYTGGFKKAIGDRAKQMIVAEATYETTDATVDSQIVTFKTSGADAFFLDATPKFGAMAIRKAYDIGWKPQIYVASVSSSVAAVLEPAGLEKSKGVISAAYQKDPTDTQWENDPGVASYKEFVKKYMPDAQIADTNILYGYMGGQLVEAVLRKCGKNPSREEIMSAACNLIGISLPMLLPGITINTSKSDYLPIEQMQLQRFDGKAWVLFGDVVN